MARRPKRGRKRLFLGTGTLSGFVVSGPVGELTTVPAGSVGGMIGAGDVVGPASSTDNAIARFSGTTGKLLQDSVPLVEDDGRISTVTNPTNAQDAATKDYVDDADAALAAAIAAIPPSTPTYYMSPLVTGGDPTTSELVFAPDGDVVMVPVYF